jgi:hypothetical protein
VLSSSVLVSRFKVSDAFTLTWASGRQTSAPRYDELGCWAIRGDGLPPGCRTCHLFQCERLASCWYKTFDILPSVWLWLKRRVSLNGMIGGRGTIACQDMEMT